MKGYIMRLLLVQKNNRNANGKAVYEIGTTKQYDAEQRKGCDGKIIKSAWSEYFCPQSNAAFNEYRQIVRRYGKMFGWYQAQEVINWLDSLKNKWYHERLQYKTGAPF